MKKKLMIELKESLRLGFFRRITLKAFNFKLKSIRLVKTISISKKILEKTLVRIMKSKRKKKVLRTRKRKTKAKKTVSLTLLKMIRKKLILSIKRVSKETYPQTST